MTSGIGRPIVPSAAGFATLQEMLLERDRMVRANPQTELGKVFECARKLMESKAHA